MAPVLFSIVVPVHDVRPYLAECLDSIFGQAYADIEVLAVDDASTDGSSELLDEYAAAEPRLSVLHLPDNVGLGPARNTGMELATGCYLLFVDSDDTLADGALAAIADRIAATDEPDVVVFGYVRTHPAGEHTPDPLSVELLAADREAFRADARPRYLDLFPVAWNKAYRREFVVDGGFRFPPGFYEDLPWTYPILISARRIVALDRVCYLYRQRAGAILRSADRRHLDFFTQLGRVFDYLDAHPELEGWRIRLYDRLTRHAPWILEIRDRVPPEIRREFYLAASESFRTHRPPGFVAPSRSAAWKIRLIERGDYRAFRAAQLANLARRRAVALRRRPSAARTDEQPTELSELLAYFVRDATFGAAAALPSDVAGQLHGALAQLTGSLDARAVAAQPGIPDELRQALLVGLKNEPAPAPRRTHDRLRGLVRIRYYVGSTAPAERITLDGAEVRPVHAKLRAISYLGRTLLRERILWLPAAAELSLDGRPPSVQDPCAANSVPARLRRLRTSANPRLLRTIFGDLITRAAARRDTARCRYRDAWLLIDRDSEAQDNAEHLYRYLRTSRPDVNAWFVLRHNSRDWSRLEQDGFRLLAYGTREYYVALLHCVQLISSQVDTYVNQPFWQHLLGTPRWRFTFLQHGVTKDDLSRWINDKPIDLVIAATTDEQRNFVADGTPYVLTSLDVALTGFPRHDRLLELGTAAENPRSLLVMPTWRQDLVGAKTGGNRRGLRTDFWDSDFASGWRVLLASDRLRELCERNGWTLTFVLHPNLQDYLDTSPLPRHVRTLRFRDIDVQEELARAAALVTDYSSLAFEAAYLERPVVYYQFDRDVFFAGSHVYRRGAWSYEEQGFGPVAATADAAIDALTRIADGTVDADYARRARNAFPHRDGRCCERTVTAIELLCRPMAADQIVQPVISSARRSP